jgi:hypothetical protein
MEELYKVVSKLGEDEKLEKAVTRPGLITELSRWLLVAVRTHGASSQEEPRIP